MWPSLSQCFKEQKTYLWFLKMSSFVGSCRCICIIPNWIASSFMKQYMYVFRMQTQGYVYMELNVLWIWYKWDARCIFLLFFRFALLTSSNVQLEVTSGFIYSTDQSAKIFFCKPSTRQKLLPDLSLYWIFNMIGWKKMN